MTLTTLFNTTARSARTTTLGNPSRYRTRRPDHPGCCNPAATILTRLSSQARADSVGHVQARLQSILVARPSLWNLFPKWAESTMWPDTSTGPAARAAGARNAHMPENVLNLRKLMQIRRLRAIPLFRFARVIDFRTVARRVPIIHMAGPDGRLAHISASIAKLR